MPLHDWSKLEGWEIVHHCWITELLRWIQPRLPAPYRAYVGAMPTLGIGGPTGKPDVHVRETVGEGRPPVTPPTNGPGAPTALAEEPAQEVIVASLAPSKTVFVECRGFLVAAIELISPRNEDRPSAREGSAIRYASYLQQGIHLLLVDVLRRAAGFSFPDRIAAELEFESPPCPVPCAVSYRVGEPIDGGRFLALWPKALEVGAPLPTLVLPLNVTQSVNVDLEQTYMRAAADAYLE